MSHAQNALLQSSARMATISDVAEFVPTVTFREAIKPEQAGRFKVIQARDVGHDGKLRIAQIAAVDDLPSGKAPLLAPGDVVIQPRGESFRAAMVWEEDGPLVASGSVLVLRPHTAQIIPLYLTLYLNLPPTQRRLRHRAEGTYVPNIRRDELAALALPIPPLEEQRRISELGDYIHRAFKLERRLFDLRLKQLHALISGGKKKAGDVGASPAT